MNGVMGDVAIDWVLTQIYNKVYSIVILKIILLFLFLKYIDINVI